jgi:hypothetical protein
MGAWTLINIHGQDRRRDAFRWPPSATSWSFVRLLTDLLPFVTREVSAFAKCEKVLKPPYKQWRKEASARDPRAHI